MKKLFALILTLTLIFCCVPFGAFSITASAESTTSGTTGDCTWSLNGTVLTISGNGVMENYSDWVDYHAPWGKSITEVIIENGVTNIGDETFYDCVSLTKITIPDSITSIGVYAFYNCTSLTSINIPNTVTSIGNRAFYNCTSLTDINIPDSVTGIGNYVFYNCTSLTKITIPNNVTSIGNYAFENCTALTSINIPVGVTSISDYTFSSCTSLTSVNIPDSVTSIGSSAFEGCLSLTSITIPNSVTSIGVYAFYACKSLKSINIPKNLTSIGDWTFYNCTSLESVYITDLKSWCNINFSDSYSSPMHYADKLYLNGEEVSGEVVIPDGATKIPDCAFYGCSNITSIVLPDSVKSIGASTFSYCTSLTSVTLGDGVTSIDDYAFRDCTLLESITLPVSLTSIGYSAFPYEINTVYYRGSENDKTKINIGSSNWDLINATWYYNSCVNSPEHIFDNENDYICNVCDFKRSEVHPYLTYTENENGAVVTGFKDGISGDIVIPETLNGMPVIAIKSKAFVYCKNITSVKIPNSVTDIKEYAFFGCNSLEKVTLGSSIKTIENKAFAECSALKTVNYIGNKVGKQLITVASGNEYLQNAEWQYDEPLEIGDVNGDNEINVSDLATLKKYIAGLLTEAEMLTVNPDVDENGTVNVADLALLKKMIAGLV